MANNTLKKRSFIVSDSRVYIPGQADDPVTKTIDTESGGCCSPSKPKVVKQKSSSCCGSTPVESSSNLSNSDVKATSGVSKCCQ